MTDREQIMARLDDLEMRFSFQEDALESLNETVRAQWAEIDRLRKLLEVLEQRVEAQDEEPREDDGDERPPHY